MAVGRSGLIAAALAAGCASALGGGFNMSVLDKAAPPQVVQVIPARKRRVGPSDPWTQSTYRRAGYGWTNAHAKRVAKKKRNRARHRAASKG
ncbi:hypothetical protein ACO2Q9_02790 [Variovorax sp. VNK109]|uniref:hypothetical protein n=1 Tax=Variovorax sp. VNK109 TaxID=3400919 RepID=UPI003C10F516